MTALAILSIAALAIILSQVSRTEKRDPTKAASPPSRDWATEGPKDFDWPERP